MRSSRRGARPAAGWRGPTARDLAEQHPARARDRVLHLAALARRSGRSGRGPSRPSPPRPRGAGGTRRSRSRGRAPRPRSRSRARAASRRGAARAAAGRPADRASGAGRRGAAPSSGRRHGRGRRCGAGRPSPRRSSSAARRPRRPTSGSASRWATFSRPGTLAPLAICVDDEVLRGAVVDRGRVHAEGADLALAHEVLGRLLAVGRESGASTRRPACRRRGRPSCPASACSSRSEQDDRAGGRSAPWRLLPLLHVRERSAGSRGRRRPAAGRRSRRPGAMSCRDGDLVGRQAVLREVDRGVEVRAAVLGRAEGVGASRTSRPASARPPAT